MDGKLYPEGVTNKDAYDEYLSMITHDLLNSERYQKTSNPKVTIDLLCFTPKVVSDLDDAGVDQEERDFLMQLHKAALSVRGTCNSLKMKAFRKEGKKFMNSSDHLLTPKRAELIELFGQFYTIDEVHQVVVTEWQIEVSKHVITAFRQRWLDKITELQEIHKRDYSSVRLAHKKSRLMELSELYVGRKTIYDKHLRKEDYILLLNTLKQIEHEVDGDQIIVNGQIVHNIEHTISVHINQQLMKDLSILEIIVGKVAAKTNVSPEYLIAKLTKGLYSKFTGFALPDNEDLSKNDISYPSQMIYDIEWLKERQDTLQKESQQKVASHSVKVSQPNLDVAKTVRQQIAERLRAKQKEVNEIRDRMDQRE